jgi:hypothetical protein
MPPKTSTLPGTQIRIEEEIKQLSNLPELTSADVDAIEHELKENKKSASKTIVKETSRKKQLTPPSTSNLNKYFVVPSSDELLKISQDLKALGVKENDFYYDSCYFLNKLRQMMTDKSFDKYVNKMYLLLPIIYPKNENYRVNNYVTNQMEPNIFRKEMRNAILGGNELDICLEPEKTYKCYIASGTFGTIYRSHFNGKNIVIKVPKTNVEDNIEDKLKIHNEVFDENIIQSELFCASRGEKNDMARIPKIEFMGRLYMPYSEMKIITGIEKLDGDLHNFMTYIVPSMAPGDLDIVLKDAMIHLCKLIEILQDRFNFHHRDLHSGNIMYKNIGNSDKPVYRWFIIDYGYAYLEMNGIQYHKDKIGVYSKYRGPNFAHDFRIFFVNMKRYYREYPKSLLLKFISYVSGELHKNFSYYVDRQHWHNAYYFFRSKFNIDNFTNPRTLRIMLETDEYMKYLQST